MFRLSDGEEIMTLAFFVLIQYRSVTDRQTDRQTDIPPLAIPAVCIARYANALVKIKITRRPAGTQPTVVSAPEKTAQTPYHEPPPRHRQHITSLHFICSSDQYDTHPLGGSVV